jgi:enolase
MSATTVPGRPRAATRPAIAIERVHARQILDSRVDPMVEVDLWLAGGVTGRTCVPPGRPPERGRLSYNQLLRIEEELGDHARNAGLQTTTLRTI